MMSGERAWQKGAVTQKDTAALERLEQPFVGIDRD
jgi:hypothetical protein